MNDEPLFEPEKLTAQLASRAQSVSTAASRDAKELKDHAALAASADALARAAAAVTRLSQPPAAE